MSTADRRTSRRSLRHFIRGERGAAAMEFALTLGVLTIPLLNVVDLAMYAFDSMQVQNAAQMGAQAAFSNCGSVNALPAEKNCQGSNSANSMTLYDAVNQGIKESALGTSVSLVKVSAGTGTAPDVGEAYYCSSSTNVLTQVGTAGEAFADNDTDAVNSSDVMPATSATTCSGYADSSTAPGDYVQVNVQYTYTPVFGFVSVASLLSNPITATAYARLD